MASMRPAFVFKQFKLSFEKEIVPVYSTRCQFLFAESLQLTVLALIGFQLFVNSTSRCIQVKQHFYILDEDV